MDNSKKRMEAAAILRGALRELERARRCLPRADMFTAGRLYTTTIALENLISGIEADARQLKEEDGK